MRDYIKREDAYRAIHAQYPQLLDAGVHLVINTIPAADVVERGVMEQYRYERDVAEKQLAEIGKCIGERMDDVVERKKGEWVEKPYVTMDGYADGVIYYCSKCRKTATKYTLSNFCPKCGADMREKEN